MEKTYILTKLGSIAVFTKKMDNDLVPIIFLHGLYFDHHLWGKQIAHFNNRTLIAIDMPLHGESKDEVPTNWTLEDCANMLIEILATLKIQKIIAIGHSWGGMTILRAAAQKPEKFSAIGFCNLPFEETSGMQKMIFQLQHQALIFRTFYMKQAGKFVFGKQSLKENPQLMDTLLSSMQKLTNKQIKSVDKLVLLDAKNTSALLAQLTMPVLALKGVDDYVGTFKNIETTLVKGGHISPLESENEVTDFCKKVINLVK